MKKAPHRAQVQKKRSGAENETRNVKPHFACAKTQAGSIAGAFRGFSSNRFRTVRYYSSRSAEVRCTVRSQCYASDGALTRIRRTYAVRARWSGRQETLMVPARPRSSPTVPFGLVDR